jgi:hypothetical protein
MLRHLRNGSGTALVAAILLLSGTSPRAHETQSVQALRVTVGWGVEPVYTGFSNFIEVDVTDAAGAPVADPAGSLSAEVTFGTERIVLPLMPEGKRAGHYGAPIVPTRPGTYMFHITGTMKGQAVDLSSTCSDRTFDCVTDVAEVQFPAKDPSPGQLAEGLGRAMPRAEQALASASAARTVAYASIALAVLAVAVAIGLGVRKGGKAA